MEQVSQANDEYLTVADVAGITKLSEISIRMKLYKKELPYTKFGRRVLVRKADLLAVLEQGYRPARAA